MGNPRKKPSLVHDPLSLLALPITSIGRGRPADDRLQPGTDGANSLGMAIAAKTIGGALFAVLIAVSLVALPGPAKDVSTIARCHVESG